MDNYHIIKHYNNDGKKIEDIILDYFKIYLDINIGSYE